MSSTGHTLAIYLGLESIPLKRLRAEANRFVASYNEHADVREVSYDCVNVDDYIVFGSLDRLPIDGIAAGEKLDLFFTTRLFNNCSRDSAMLLGFLMVLDYTFETVDLDVITISANASFLQLALNIARRHYPDLPSPLWVLKSLSMEPPDIPGWMDFRT